MSTGCSEEVGCNCTATHAQSLPPLLAEHIHALHTKAQAFAASATMDITTKPHEDLHQRLLSIAGNVFFSKYNFAYGSAPPDMKPGGSIEKLYALVTIPQDDVEQAKRTSGLILKNRVIPEWFVTQFTNEITTRVGEVLNVSDPDRWDQSGLKATYGNPEDSNDRIEVRAVYLYTNVETSEGTVQTVVYYLGEYYPNNSEPERKIQQGLRR